MTPTWQSDCGTVSLYWADCLDVLPHLSGVDAVVTDPPYGIGVDRSMAAASGTQYGRAAAAKRNYIACGWDDAPMSLDVAEALIAASKWQIFWGGNYYGLPASRCWLVWDKENGTNAFADCELAWTNFDKPVRKFTWMWNGMIRRGGEDRNGHPTQKPVALMEWCLGFVPNAQTILDPFMGSGTTGIACIRKDRRFIGIEKEKKYFDIAVERISAELSRMPLLTQG